jgi:hypothetical protein
MNNKPTMRCSVFLGRSVVLEKVSGKVIAKDGWSETHVHGGGGGGYGGHSASVHINSTVVKKDKVWLVDQDDKEFTWNLTESDLGPREGHILSAASPQKGSKFVAAYNHNLDKFEWWGGDLSLPHAVAWTIILLPICLLWIGKFYFPGDVEWIAKFFSPREIYVETSLAIGLSIGWFFGSAVAYSILAAIFVYIRKKLFSVRYKSSIKNLLKEDVLF